MSPSRDTPGVGTQPWTVVNPLQPKYRAQSSVNKGAAMEGRKREKHKKYVGKLEANMVLRPLVFETLGG